MGLIPQNYWSSYRLDWMELLEKLWSERVIVVDW